MGSAEDQLDFDREVEDGWAIFVPAGTWHNVTNIGDEPLQLYAVYAPVHHAPGKVQPTAEDAERDEESGKDEPPSWSVPTGRAAVGPARLSRGRHPSPLSRRCTSRIAISRRRSCGAP